MKTLLVGFALVMALAGTARAHDAYDDTQSNPLRVVAYLLYPVGYTAEWLLFRPLHFVVSQPALEPVFGHAPHESSFGDYRAYRPEED